MATLELLYQLEKLDKEDKGLKKSIEEDDIVGEINILKEAVLSIKKDWSQKNKEVEDLKHQIKEEEFKDARLIRKEKDYQQQLYSGATSNPKELQKLQEKLDTTLESKKELEDELLELMLELEAKEDELLSLRENLDSKQEELIKLEEDYQEGNTKINQELDRVNSAKEDIFDKLEDEMISKYEDLYRRKRGRVVVEVSDGYCMGCRMLLPVNLVEEVKSSEEIVYCENCGRILYWRR
ncbi:hypothetical protein BX659_11348 [Orenia metallireducens]|jgi:hypothetical protein|uniref:Uncharacterized protein n=1 Tax=Orenia metallireducens TaxID=1413210 RepID=A0A285G981_9FIRM|nr:C4-type zinc ribbon domain-containing protein [Orenia metallireducens]PRX28317.1 hypothetical protein BX659_11348 [Orenia metallireducens]SNY18971.1 hypothetical protein SAMN06265827_10545 [Orenia metallireducens]